jgi:hypothetical protein
VAGKGWSLLFPTGYGLKLEFGSSSFLRKQCKVLKLFSIYATQILILWNVKAAGPQDE